MLTGTEWADRQTHAVSLDPCQANSVPADKENISKTKNHPIVRLKHCSTAVIKMLLAGEIRILDILPSGADGTHEPIRCSIRTAELADKPTYEAMSYRWGDPNDTVSITVDDKPTFVTANLHAALCRVRLEDQVRSVWIDQLCIDQEDMEEKAKQVRFMGDIYSNCSQCLIWLDEIDPGVSLADAEAAIDILNWMLDPELPVPACIQLPATVEGPMRALESIGVDKHEWWKRIWTVQEVILPPQKVILWGPLQIPWDTLSRCAHVWTVTGAPAELLQLSWRVPAANTERVLGWLFCNVIWINIAHGERDEPVLTAMKWRGRKATDQRDKIFGLLGLLPGAMELPHTDRCDYETTTAQVYNAFTLDMILDDKGLLPLCNEPRAPRGMGTEGIARWATDVDCEMPHQVDTFYRYWGYGSYDACAGRELDAQALLDAARVEGPADHMRKLGLSGVMVDTIELTSSKTLLGSCTYQEVSEVLKIWMEMAQVHNDKLASEIPRERIEEDFCKLVVSNRVRNSELWSVRSPTQEDLETISGFIRTARGDIGGLPLADRYVTNQTFFITKNGTIGLGHLETAPRDEVWVFDGGKMPFTVRQREKGGKDEFDFVGCCYAHGIMDGEVYLDQRTATVTPRRTIYLN